MTKQQLREYVQRWFDCYDTEWGTEGSDASVALAEVLACLADEPRDDAEFLSLVGHCSNCSCQDCRAFFKADARARAEPPAAYPFVVRWYVGNSTPELKGNGFDGLPIGGRDKDAREEVQRFVDFVNERIAQNRQAAPDRKSALDEIVRISEEAGLYEDRPAKCANCGAPLYSGTCQCCATPVNRGGDSQ